MSKQEIWTKRCQDGRACAYDPNNLEKFKKVWKEITGRDDFEETHQPGLIPDDVDICDACLLAKYQLEPEYDQCDRMGFGPRYIEEHEAIRALREAERVQRG